MKPTSKKQRLVQTIKNKISKPSPQLYQSKPQINESYQSFKNNSIDYEKIHSQPLYDPEQQYTMDHDIEQESVILKHQKQDQNDEGLIMGEDYYDEDIMNEIQREIYTQEMNQYQQNNNIFSFTNNNMMNGKKLENFQQKNVKINKSTGKNVTNQNKKDIYLKNKVKNEEIGNNKKEKGKENAKKEQKISTNKNHFSIDQLDEKIKIQKIDEEERFPQIQVYDNKNIQKNKKELSKLNQSNNQPNGNQIKNTIINNLYLEQKNKKTTNPQQKFKKQNNETKNKVVHQNYQLQQIISTQSKTHNQIENRNSQEQDLNVPKKSNSPIDELKRFMSKPSNTSQSLSISKPMKRLKPDPSSELPLPSEGFLKFKVKLNLLKSTDLNVTKVIKCLNAHDNSIPRENIRFLCELQDKSTREITNHEMLYFYKDALNDYYQNIHFE